MGHIPKDDIEQIWNETPEHNWSALHKTLEQHKDKAKGIEDELVDTMLRITKDFEQSGRQYPDSPAKLYEIMNERA